MGLAETRRLLVDAPQYRSTAVVRARRLGDESTWRSSQGSALQAKAGDWELTDAVGRRWTVDDEIFRASYERRDDGRYVKVGTVRAVRLTAAQDVPTLEGDSRAEAGDWLLCGGAGELWPVPDTHFSRHYRPV